MGWPAFSLHSAGVRWFTLRRRHAIRHRAMPRRELFHESYRHALLCRETFREGYHHALLLCEKGHGMWCHAPL